MTMIHQKFISDSEQISFDLKHRKTIAFNMGRYNAAVMSGKLQYTNLALARRQASLKKHRSIENLENTLKIFEQNFIRNGGKVFWAVDADEGNRIIGDILTRHGARLVVKSKSMVSEELQLDAFLQTMGIESIETDLGEYIVQISGDKPYHIVTPVMHRSAKEISAIFHEKFGMSPESTPQEIAAFVRKTLREKFYNADAGITGANFIVSSTGSIALTENEGNGVLSSTMPKVHVVVAGIEKVIDHPEDLHLFWPLLATFGTGQRITAYNSIISGPRQKGESDGPEHMYVVLLDNGRTNLLRQIPQRRALSCIRCGSCLNGCPIYHNIGGHTYGSVYSGPIGAVITPHLRSMMHYKHLSYATSLCGNCTDVCPVNIDLHHLLLENRNYSVKQNMAPGLEKMAMFAWRKVMMNRKLMDLGGAGIKNFFLKKFLAKSWGKRREVPTMAKKNFSQLWKEQKG